MQPSTPEPEQKPKSIHDLLSLAGTIIPIIVGASFLLSICYDYFFLGALGLSFSNIPSQVSDHIRSAILWLPAMAGFFTINFLIFAILDIPSPHRRINYFSGKSGDFIIIFRFIFLVIALIVQIMVILFAPAGMQLQIIIPIFVLLYFMDPSMRVHKFNNIQFKFYSIMAVLTFSVAASSGYLSATGILSEESPKIVLLIKVDDKTDEIKANGIRRFSEFSIVIDHNRQTTILPKDSILSEKSIKPIAIKESRACEYFQFGCKNKPVTPPAKASSSP